MERLLVKACLIPRFHSPTYGDRKLGFTARMVQGAGCTALLFPGCPIWLFPHCTAPPANSGVEGLLFNQFVTRLEPVPPVRVGLATAMLPGPCVKTPGAVSSCAPVGMLFRPSRLLTAKKTLKLSVSYQMPPPPRTTVLPFPRTSQAKPKRGA